MASYGLCFVLIVQIYVVSVQGKIIKSSLTFVIDDTLSMSEEIRSLKEEVNIIFDKVLSSKASQIENFVIVTFNDLDAEVRTITKDPNEFKRALASIRIHSDLNYDCSEKAMTGIELGLTNSLPLSFLYVFTDASASDYEKLEQIKSLSQKKLSQVVFLLTGLCGSTSDARYQAYHQVAQASGGQVFNMKADVKDVGRLNNAKPGDYEVEMEGRGEVNKIMIAKSDLNFQLGFSINSPSSMEDTVTRPPPGGKAFLGIRLLGEGVEPTTAKILDLNYNVIAELPLTLVDKKEQFYVTPSFNLPYSLFFVIVIGNDLKTGTPVVRTARTPIARPLPEAAVNTAPEITIQGAPKIIVEYDAPLKLKCIVHGYPAPNIVWSEKDTKIQMPAKVHSVDVPYDYVSILDINKANKNVVYQCEASNGFGTVIKYVEVETERKIYFDVTEAPKEGPVIDKSPLIRVPEKKNAALSCRILQSNPKPTISWSFQAAGTYTFSVMTETTQTVHLNNVRKDQTGTYKCTAKNAQGSDSFSMGLVVEFPPTIENDDRVKEIKDGDEVRIPCDVTGEPSPTVSWFFKGIRLASSAKISVSSDNSIKFNATPSDIGDYTCEAKNKLDTAKKTVFLNVLEAPVIDKSLKDIVVTEKTNAVLSCRILRGNPKPSILWYFQPAGTYTFSVMTETTQTVHLTNVHRDQTGTYKCSAKNAQGSDSFTIKLVVEYPPIIKKDMTLIEIKNGDEVRILCDVTGEPAPAVKWFFYDPSLGNAAKAHKSSDHSFRFKAGLRDVGFYTCEATNKLGVAKKTTELQVYIPVTIETTQDRNIETMVGESEILNCRAGGYPRPHIKWTFQSSDPKIPAKDITPTSGVQSVALRNLQLEEQGSYTCEAENGIGGSASITYDVNVYAPPVIVNTYPSKNFEAMEGDLTLRIQCKTTGRPTPSIVWTKKGLNLAMGSEWYDMEDDGTLIIKNIDRASEGSYVCHAENFLGHVTELYEVTVLRVVPVTIETTQDRNIEKIVGASVILNCRAGGYPRPHIKWTFQSSDPKIPAKDITPTSGVQSVALRNLQLEEQGSYTCEAENGIGGSASITYDVNVYAPPVIVNTYPYKNFEAMEGDMTLRIQCKTTGRPTPSIFWTKTGLNLEMGSEWYDMEDDGTLIIKNIDRASEGSYVCHAENFFGHVTERYEITVLDHLVPAVPTSTVFVKEGETVNINCDIPHRRTDQMRWYKDSLAIASGELTLYSVTRSDDGLYTCRVSNAYKSRSVTTKVVVGYKPEFTTKEKEIVEFVDETDSVFLSCVAYGQPMPTTATWKHNGNTLDSKEMSYPLGMVYGATGTYECEVSNAFGSIRRTFKVTSRVNNTTTP